MGGVDLPLHIKYKDFISFPKDIGKYEWILNTFSLLFLSFIEITVFTEESVLKSRYKLLFTKYENTFVDHAREDILVHIIFVIV